MIVAHRTGKVQSVLTRISGRHTSYILTRKAQRRSRMSFRYALELLVYLAMLDKAMSYAAVNWGLVIKPRPVWYDIKSAEAWSQISWGLISNQLRLNLKSAKAWFQISWGLISNQLRLDLKSPDMGVKLPLELGCQLTLKSLKPVT